MKEKVQAPELRFDGFTDDWELRKLTNITSSYSGLTYSPTDIQDTGTFVLRSSNVKNDQLIDADNVYVNPDIVNSINVKVGDVIIVVRNGSRALIGKHAIVNEEMPDTVIGAFMSAFRGENGNYINALLSTDNFQKEVHKSLGATINQITGKDFSMMIFPTPKFGEQQKIGAFFKQLDYTIALHQRKLDLLKEQKKGYLQKMFPKNGAKVPELRFAGFADDWEERKFKDNIVSIQTGTNLLGSTVNEGTPLIKMGNLQRGYFSFKKLEYLDSNSNVGSEDIVNYGDFLFNTRNTLELVGKGATWTGIGGKYAFNSNIARFKFDGIDTIFFNYLYNTQQVISQVHARAVGTTSVSAVYPRDLNSLLYYLPSIEEQQKIGSFFKQLDDTIALHQRKLDLLKEQKKGFLQKMFM